MSANGSVGVRTGAGVLLGREIGTPIALPVTAYRISGWLCEWIRHGLRALRMLCHHSREEEPRITRR